MRLDKMTLYPTAWQRKVMWAALTAFFIVLLILILGSVIWVSANIISFLQPILIPVAIAVILSYLLDPLVARMSRGALSRAKAVALLFAIAFFALGGLAAWLVPTVSIQSSNFAKQIPAYTERARDYIVDLIFALTRRLGCWEACAGNPRPKALPTGSLERRPHPLLTLNRPSPPRRAPGARPRRKQSRQARPG